jgi:hypothetical protein
MSISETGRTRHRSGCDVAGKERLDSFALR